MSVTIKVTEKTLILAVIILVAAISLTNYAYSQTTYAAHTFDEITGQIAANQIMDNSIPLAAFEPSSRITCNMRTATTNSVSCGNGETLVNGGCDCSREGVIYFYKDMNTYYCECTGTAPAKTSALCCTNVNGG